MVAAGSTAWCRPPAIERFASRLRGGRTSSFAGARHELMMERDRCASSSSRPSTPSCLVLTEQTA